MLLQEYWAGRKGKKRDDRAVQIRNEACLQLSTFAVDRELLRFPFLFSLPVSSCLTGSSS